MKKIRFLFVAQLVLLCSCTKTAVPDYIVPEEYESDIAVEHEMLVLGKRLEDPYTVENMGRALNSLYPTKAGRIALSATNLYVRFLPEDDEQYKRLEKLGVVMLDHPVDYEILKEGDWYRDPSLGEQEITWQYAVVDKDFRFPEEIRHELIDECYLPESDATKAGGIDWDAVEAESYRLTGNGDMICGTKGDDGGTPSGRIAILDPAYSSSPIAVTGVKVSCNSFVKFASAYTDANGYYEMDRHFSSSVRYRLVFNNVKGFSLGFNWIVVPASISSLGKYSASGLNICVDQNSERKLFSRCVVNNAGYDYYNSCEDNGLKIATPPSDLRIWLFQNLNPSSCSMLHHGVWLDNGLLSEFLGDYTWIVKIFMPDITLGLNNHETYSQIYSSAVHEFAHASHFRNVGIPYWEDFSKFIVMSYIESGFVAYGSGTEEGHGFCEVGEMWAYANETILYRKRYGYSSYVFGTHSWFYPQILVNLDERGLSRFKIFKALAEDVDDVEKLRTRLTELYPECRYEINEAFGRYK